MQGDLFEHETEAQRKLIDALVAETRLYTTTEAHREFLEFVVRLRSFAPFNAMLLHIQKPGLTPAVTALDWAKCFGRHPKEDARPLVVLHRLLLSAILRRLGTSSRERRLSFAFRELGRAIRTRFGLRTIGSLDLRRAIGAATDKSEHFNRYAQRAGLGGAGLVTASARDEQRKMVKYNHLVANLLIFHTAVGMTRALDRIAADGLDDAVNPEALATLSP